MQYTVSIRRNVDFRRMYYKERFKIGFFSVIYLKKVNFDGAFLGITVSKKVGNAVERNRVRRVIKAAYYEVEKSSNLKGLCMVVVAKKSCLNAKSHSIARELRKNIFYLSSEKFVGQKRI